MRIVLLGPAYPYGGGVPHFTAALHAELTAAGHRVRVVNFNALFGAHAQQDDSPFARRLDSDRLLNPWNPASWKKTADVIAAERADLLLFMWWLPGVGPAYRGVMRFLPESNRRKVVFLIHDALPHRRFPGDAFLARMALKPAAGYLALSQAEAGVLRSILPDVNPARIHISPHPVFTSYELYAGTPEQAREALGVSAKHVLLFFGFVLPYKGLDLFIRALPEVIRQRPDTVLLICGPFQQDRGACERLSAELGVRSHLVVHDRYFSGPDVSACFAAADAVVLPYRSATQSGVIPLAYGLGVPVIATSVGALSEAVRDGQTGYLVPPDDPARLSEAVDRFYTAGGRPAFQTAIRAEASRYTWDHFLQSIQTIHDHLS